MENYFVYRRIEGIGCLDLSAVRRLLTWWGPNLITANEIADLNRQQQQHLLPAHAKAKHTIRRPLSAKVPQERLELHSRSETLWREFWL
jgi:hypothetical protein